MDYPRLLQPVNCPSYFHSFVLEFPLRCGCELLDSGEAYPMQMDCEHVRMMNSRPLAALLHYLVMSSLGQHRLYQCEEFEANLSLQAMLSALKDRPPSS